MLNYKIVDLFSGAGGMSLGFEQEGFESVLAIESEKSYANTFKINFPNTIVLNQDIKKIKKNQILEMVNNQKIDVIIGGPPCQGFSIAGNIGRRFLEDERNSLFREFIRIVKYLNPKIFVMENVARLETHNKGNTIKEIYDAFAKIGYTLKHKVINSVDFEVPQKRNRIFIIGTKSNNIFTFPQKSNLKKTVKDAISDLPPLVSAQKSDIPNHNAMNHSEQMLLKMSFVTENGNRNLIPKKLRPTSGDVRKYIRYISNEPSICITGDMRKVFHYNQNRALTARELARIQTFPDNFIFSGNSIEVQQQIGNAVPPLLAKKIAESVRRYLDEL